MTTIMLQGTVQKVEVIHREGFTTRDGNQRLARIVVWATTAEGKRVWVHTVEGRLDSVLVMIKVAMAEEYYKNLVGYKISFHNGKFRGEGDIFFADQESIPQKFLISYTELKEQMWEWVKKNYATELTQLRRKMTEKAVTTGVANAENNRTPK